MSNTEMVSVPRELAARIARSGCWPNDAEELRALLAQPAEQHQGEPVALPERKQIAGPPQPYTQRGHSIGWNACLDEIAKLGPLYCRPVHGEPVAWRFVEPGDEHSGYEQKVRVTVERPSATRARLGCEPLYAHADPGEVEQYKQAVERLAVTIAKQQETFSLEIRKAEALLAEWGALLAESHDLINSGNLAARNEPTRQSAGILRDRIKAALSASAEPSAPVERDERAGITLGQVLKAYDYANDHPHKYLRGTTNWCAAVAHSLNKQALERNP